MSLAVVAMSGGVDSSVAAALLVEAGYRVRGVSLSLWDAPRRGDRICSDHREARRIAEHLGIEHTEIDQRSSFAEAVVEPFAGEYARGTTPNPCVACNSRFKLGVLARWAFEQGAEIVATGHYARVANGNGSARLLRGVDPGRDQSYFLFELSRKVLDRLVLPVGELTKHEVRSRARSLRLPSAERLDSQDLCFGAPGTFVRSRIGGGRDGTIVDADGRVLGRHSGIEDFTVGQRRGLGVATGRPLYVQSIDAPRRRVVVAQEAPVASGLVARHWNWLAEPPEPDEVVVAQVRHRHAGVAATVRPDDVRRNRWRVDFTGEGAVVAPGQAVVVYRDTELLGGGWIESPL